MLAKSVSERFQALKARSGLSWRQVAVGMGYKRESSIQRYYENYPKEALPLEIVHKIRRAFVGHGKPPITDQEVMDLAFAEFGEGGNVVKIPLKDEPILDEDARRNVPIRGTAVGGRYGDFSFNGEEAGYAVRPPGLVGVSDVFAVYYDGVSMRPRFRRGDILFVKEDIVRPGDDVILEVVSEDGEPPAALVKELVVQTPERVVVHQYNPEEDLTFERKVVVRIYRIIPNSELFT